MPVLAIDQGTSATKALVVDDAGTVLGAGNVPVTVHAGADGSVECDPDELWASVVTAGEAAVRAAGSPTLDAIGLANQGETVLPWDRATGAPLGRAVVWQDGRAASVCDALRPHGERLQAITGLPLDPYFVAPKLVWLRDRVGPGTTITTTDAWLLHRLCGAFATDVSTASRSLLLDLDTARWSPEACDVFGLAVDELPTVVDNAGALGETSVFGGRAAPVAGVCVDQQAALFAESCLTHGEAKCTYGTGAFLLATTSVPTRSTHGLVGCVAWCLDGTTTWCLDAQVFTVGAAVHWLEQLGVIAGPADLDTLGASVSDSGGVQFVPALAGLGAPFWRPDARGAFTGLSLATERAHVVRAVVDGVAANVAVLAGAVGDDLGAPLARLRVDGGLTRSRLLLQRQADLAQVPVEVYPSPDATALGVAAFARLGIGAAASPADAIGSWSPSAVVEPSINADEAAAHLDAWRRAADATAAL